MNRYLSQNRLAFVGLLIGVTLIVGAALYYILGVSEEPISWELTLVGKNDEQRLLDYQEICQLPYKEARGGFFTTVGVVNGPFEVKGVLLLDLCELVGGIAPEDVVAITAVDGYSMVFDYDQLHGDIETYDPVTIHEVPHETLMVLLTYEQDGKTLLDSDGKPLRVAVVGSEALLTEGHNWVKWVNKIEVISLE